MIGSIITNGFGAWSSVALLVTQGYAIGEEFVQEPICFFAVLCSGVANVNRTDSGIAMTAELEGERLVP